MACEPETVIYSPISYTFIEPGAVLVPGDKAVNKMDEKSLPTCACLPDWWKKRNNAQIS